MYAYAIVITDGGSSNTRRDVNQASNCEKATHISLHSLLIPVFNLIQSSQNLIVLYLFTSRPQGALNSTAILNLN